jgi:hypothetical protein
MCPRTLDVEREPADVCASVAGMLEPVEEKAASPEREDRSEKTEDMGPLERAAWRLWKPALLQWHAAAQRWEARDRKRK